VLDVLRREPYGIDYVLLVPLELLPLELILINYESPEVVSILSDDLEVRSLHFIHLLRIHGHEGLLVRSIISFVNLDFFLAELEVFILGFELSQHTRDQLLYSQG